MARICIISPGALGSNPRVVKEATLLAEHGHEVDVLSTRTLDQVDPLDEDILATAKWHSHRLDLRARLPHLVRRCIQMTNAKLHQMTGLRTFSDRSFSAFTAPLISAARGIAADLYIAHYPGALPAAVRAAKRHGALYAFDAEDFHPGDFPDEPAYVQLRRSLHAIEGRYLPGCAYMTAASPGIAEAYGVEYEIPKPTLVLNTFSKSDAPPAATAQGEAVPGPSLYWFSQTIGPDRGLECAVRAIAKARTRPHLYLRGGMAQNFEEVVRSLAAANGVKDRVRFLPTASPGNMIALAAPYDAGLVGETGWTTNRRLALTNKQFTYLLAGLPVIMSDVPAHKDFAATIPGAGYIYPVDDATALATQLDTLFSDPGALAAARSVAHRYGQERYNWEIEQEALLKIITHALEGSSAP